MLLLPARAITSEYLEESRVSCSPRLSPPKSAANRSISAFLRGNTADDGLPGAYRYVLLMGRARGCRFASTQGEFHVAILSATRHLYVSLWGSTRKCRIHHKFLAKSASCCMFGV